MKLPRPHIPLAVRVAVAERQLRGFGEAAIFEKPDRKLSAYLDRLLLALQLCFGDMKAKLELHHRPALVNRRRYVRNGKTFYDPPANDPEHLFYVPEDDHDIETRVRGLGAQRSDLAQARYNKRVRKNREKRKAAAPALGAGFRTRVDKSKPKAKWASRPLRSASRWPAKGSRKLGKRIGT